ncbi:MAG: hypothetical protein CSA04_02470 [Bacteroidetes bacterium]|nr:MAG: hypothetical protein CSA04_02470 [Bacteroidota bacterium]
MAQKNTPLKAKMDRNTIVATLFSIFSIFVVYLIQHPKILNLQLWPRYITLSLTVLGFSLFFLFQKKSHKSTINNGLLRNPLYIVYGLLTLVMFVSLIHTINWRSEGIMDSSKYLLMFMFLGLSLIIYNDDKGYKIVSKVVVFIGLGLLIWAFAQYIPRYLFNSTGGVRNMDDVRVNFVRSNQYCIGVFLLLPFLLYQFFRDEKVWNTLSAIALFGNLFFIISIQTRSVWAAMLLGGFFVGILFLLTRRRKLSERKRRIIFRRVLLLIGAAILSFVIAEGLNRYFGNNRGGTLSDGVKKTFDSSKKFGAGSRLVRWEATLRLVKANPFWGEGAGDWKTVKYKYGLYDNSVTPHNDYLWVYSDAGIMGFLLYMALFLFAFIYLIRTWIYSPHEEDRIMALALLFGLMGYMAIQFFTFPKKGISHQVMLTLYFAFSIILHARMREREKRNIPQWIFNGGLIMVLLVTPVMVAFASIRFKSERVERIALSYRAGGDHRGVIKYMSQANNKWSNIDPFNHSISSYVAEGHFYLEEHTKAIKYYTQALRESPYNPNYWVNRAMAYSKLDMNDKAMKDLNMALKLNPDYILALTNKAVLYFNGKDFDAAMEILFEILEKKPGGEDAGKANYMLGMIYLNRNQREEACPYLEEAMKKGFSQAKTFYDRYCKE